MNGLCGFFWDDHECDLDEGHDGPHRCCCGDEPPATEGEEKGR